MNFLRKTTTPNLKIFVKASFQLCDMPKLRSFDFHYLCSVLKTFSTVPNKLCCVTFSTAPAGKCRCRSLPLTRLCPSNPSRSAWLLRIYNSWFNPVLLSLAQYQCGMAALILSNGTKPNPGKRKLCRFPHNRSKLRFDKILWNYEKDNENDIYHPESLPGQSTSTCPPLCLVLVPCLPPPPSPGCSLWTFMKYKMVQNCKIVTIK